MVAGLGTAGALAAAAAAIPTRRQVPAEAAAAAAPAVAQGDDSGYRLSEHVLRYYQTTRV